MKRQGVTWSSVHSIVVVVVFCLGMSVATSRRHMDVVHWTSGHLVTSGHPIDAFDVLWTNGRQRFRNLASKWTLFPPNANTIALKFKSRINSF
jgi:hypothetical protein